jgi:hypothetical protein
MREMADVCNILVGKLEGKRQKHTWEDNFKMLLKEIRFGGMVWIHLAKWLALVNMVMNH